jgi:hypothetical protein
MSNVGIAEVLSLVQDRQQRVKAYYSKTLNKAGRNYCVSGRELLAIVRTLQHFPKYFYGQELYLRTDHSALTGLTSFKKFLGQTVCRIQHLQAYSSISEPSQGWKHNSADAPSQRPCQEECEHCQKVEARAEVKQMRAIASVAADGWDPTVIRRNQMKDHDV